MTKRIVILGSTGSIGRQALQVVEAFPEDYQVVGLAAGANLDLLAQQVDHFKPQCICLGKAFPRDEVIPRLGKHQPEILSGQEGLVHLAQLEGIDLILIAVTGINGLLPTLAAIEKGTPVALANKETLVCGGDLVTRRAREKGVPLLPVDSEHSAIFQCLERHNQSAIAELILTASGGPFINYTVDELEQVTPAKALQHPNWSMGSKITIDSAGLINKGLEVIEAYWLFNVPYEKIKVVVHPQSIIHSLVHYEDGAILAQLGLPDMRVPIQYAFTYPNRRANDFPKLNLLQTAALTFLAPDHQRFPGLALAYEAGKAGGTMPAVYNAANEIAAGLFMEEKIKFNEIPVIIDRVMHQHQNSSLYDVESLLSVDQWARCQAKKVYQKNL